MLGWFYLLFLGVLLLATIVVGVISLYNPNLIKGQYTKAIYWVLISIAIAFIGFALFMPFLMHSVLKDVGDEIKEYDKLGNAIGGLMTPFIAISAVIVTGLAFYAQYQANQQIRKQFNLQQFETQFYKMLQLHKDNVNEIELRVYEEKVTPKSTNKVTEVKKIEFTDAKLVKGRKVFNYYVQEFHVLLSCIGKSELERINEGSFAEAYNMFFDGMEKFSYMEDLFSPTFRNAVEREISSIKRDGLKQHIHLHTYFDLFNGHAEYLGHYYRHLYMTVKYVVESYEKRKILESKKECLKYLKVLRAQLSNAEQIMLFYNWIAGYGANWERDKRRYFSKYLMIHNLPLARLFSKPFPFIKGKVQEIYARSEKSTKLFEHNIDAYLKHLDES